MKKTKFLAGLLALTLLAGCAPAGPKESGGNKGDDLAWEAAGIKKDYALLTVNGEEVPAEEYLFWLANAIALEQQYYGGLSTDAQWEGQSASLKALALESVKIHRIILAKAAEYGAELSEAQQADVEQQLAYAVEMYGGESGYQTFLDSMCVSRELFEKLYQVYFLNEALLEKMLAQGDITVDEADRDSFVTRFMEENGVYGAKHILISTRRQTEDGKYVDFSDEEKAEALARIQGLLDQVRAAENTEETFTALMAEYSEDGRDPSSGKLYYPDGYTLAYAGQMVPEFETAALALEVGQVSDVVTTDYGYHIILRVPADEAKVRDYATDERIAANKLDELTQQWVKEAKVETTQAYDDLDPKDFSEKLTAASEAREIARALESSAPTETPAQ